MLDWLMEDTCRVGVKPTFAAGGGGGLPDAARATLAWRKHLSRNDSVVTDVFTGQFRSQLRCEACGEVSTSFDPFSSLALALPPSPAAKLQRRFVVVQNNNPKTRTIWVKHSLFFDPGEVGPLTAGHVAAWLAAQNAGGAPNYVLSRAMLEKAADGGAGQAAAEEWHVALHVIVDTKVEGKDTYSSALVPMLPEARVPDYVTDWDKRNPMPGGDPYLAEPVAFIRAVCFKSAAAEGGAGSSSSSSGGGGGGSGGSRGTRSAACYFVAFPSSKFARRVLLHGESLSEDMSPQDSKVDTQAVDAMLLPLAPGNTEGNVHAFVSRIFAKVFAPLSYYYAPQPPSFTLVRTAGALDPAVFASFSEKPLYEQTFRAFVAALLGGRPSGSASAREVRAGSQAPWGEKPGGGVDDEVTLWVLPAGDYAPNQGSDDHDSFKRATQHLGLPRPPALTLAECLSHFQRPERLTEDNRAKCPNCGTREDTEKTLAIWKAPPVLTVHLKRFKTGPGGFYGGHVLRKNGEPVDFPVFGLDLAPYVVGPPEAQALPEALGWGAGAGAGEGGGGGGAAPAPPPPPLVYDLFAVSHHEGGLGGGHYTAHVQDFSTGGWFYCDDRLVSPSPPSDAMRSSAYVLFYRRRDTLGPELSAANAAAEERELQRRARVAVGGGGGGSSPAAGKRARSRSRSSSPTPHRTMPPSPISATSLMMLGNGSSATV
jgi:hypothetical protein